MLKWVNALLRPRLGRLEQHSPREFRLPSANLTFKTLPYHTPSISIVTPSFNQAQFLARTIESVLKQNYPLLEYFVQDGASTDNSQAVLTEYESRLTGWRSEHDTGQTQAINRGFSRSTGEIMGWLNSDDLLLPNALHYVAEYFSDPEIDVVYGHRILINEDDRLVGRWVMPTHSDSILAWADYIPQETMFWRRRIWDKAGGSLDESLSFAMDWDMILRFREAGANFARIPQFLGAFRVHRQQKTSAIISEVGYGEMDRLRRRALGHVPSRFEQRRAVSPYLLRHILADLAWQVRNRPNGPL